MNKLIFTVGMCMSSVGFSSKEFKNNPKLEPVLTEFNKINSIKNSCDKHSLDCYCDRREDVKESLQKINAVIKQFPKIKGQKLEFTVQDEKLGKVVQVVTVGDSQQELLQKHIETCKPNEVTSNSSEQEVSCRLYFPADPTAESFYSAANRDEAMKLIAADNKKSTKRKKLIAKSKPGFVVLCDPNGILIPPKGQTVFTSNCSAKPTTWNQFEGLCQPKGDKIREVFSCAKDKALAKCRDEAKEKCKGIVGPERYKLDLEAATDSPKEPVCQVFVDVH